MVEHRDHLPHARALEADQRRNPRQQLAGAPFGSVHAGLGEQHRAQRDQPGRQIVSGGNAVVRRSVEPFDHRLQSKVAGLQRR